MNKSDYSDHKVHITGLTKKGREDPCLAQAFKEMIKSAEAESNQKAPESR